MVMSLIGLIHSFLDSHSGIATTHKPSSWLLAIYIYIRYIECYIYKKLYTILCHNSCEFSCLDMFMTCLWHVYACLSTAWRVGVGAIARASLTGHGAANATSLWRCWTEEGHLLWLLWVPKEFQGVPRSSKIPDLWMLILKCMGFGLFGLFGLYLFGVSFCCSSSIKRTCMNDWWWFSGVVMGNYMTVLDHVGKAHVSTPALEAHTFSARMAAHNMRVHD